jgi:predicted glycosyltransferase
MQNYTRRSDVKRILIYSHDTFGLGNIRRMLEVARHIVQSSPQVSVLVITGSPMLHAFRIPARIDYLKLPCLSRSADGHYGARFLDLSLHDTVRLRANIIRSAIADFGPDLILVDKKPFGVEDELSGALADLQSNAQRPKLVLLLRDILDSNEATTRVWRKNGYFEAIEAFYDQVLVVGTPQVFDLRREYQFPPFAAAKVQFCGYIAREPGRKPRNEMRRQLGVTASDPLVLVTPGGGEDGFSLVSTTLEALASLSPENCPRTHIVCGPEMDEEQRFAVHSAAQLLPNISVQDFSDDMMSLMAAADVVVAMGGYNTVCELLTLHRRALLVPRIRPGTEQLIRAQCMASRGFVRMLHPDALTPTALWAGLRSELREYAAHCVLPKLCQLDGLTHVTNAILDAVGLDAEMAAPDTSTPEAAWSSRRITQPAPLVY